MNRKDIRNAIAVWTANQMNACETAEEQQAFTEEFIKVAIGIYTVRFRDEPIERKTEAMKELTQFLKSAVMSSSAKLMNQNKR